VLTVDVAPEWHITGSLLEGFDQPVCRFIPGISRGEGLFMCVLRKAGETTQKGRFLLCKTDKTTQKEPSLLCNRPQADLSYQQAMSYLRGEALHLPEDMPRGEVEVCFEGHPLGQVKNIGTRANNLYPKEWRIRTTHIPSEYEPILKQL
jgi:hypothetical protein